MKKNRKYDENSMRFKTMERILGKVIATSIEPAKEVSLNFERRYFREIVWGGEVFINRNDFVITSKFSNLLDLAYIKKFKYAKNPGIYIVFNDEYLYIGQSATAVIERLSRHQLEGKKEHVIDEGEVLFFGRVDRSLGKDQLDYIEKFLIARLKSGAREVINDKDGNTSHCSKEHQEIADYLIEFAYKTAFISRSNPFRKEEVISYTREAPKEKTDWSKFLESTNNLFTDELLEQIESRAKKEFKNLAFIEYVWPENGRTKAIERIGSPNPFYIEARDGIWPEDFKEVESFEYELLENYRIRKKKS